MRIYASDWYRSKAHDRGECGARDCERHYCPDFKTHRLLYRTCESVKDYDDMKEWYSGECPQCHEDYETKQRLIYRIKQGDNVPDELRAKYGIGGQNATAA